MFGSLRRWVTLLVFASPAPFSPACPRWTTASVACRRLAGTRKTCGEETCRHDICNEREVKAAAEACGNGMATSGVSTSTWTTVGLHQTEIRAHYAHMGQGGSVTSALIEWLHERGLKFGLYTSAGNIVLVRRGATDSRSRGHYDADAKAFAAWGVDYVKLDWCGDIKKQVLKGKSAHVDFARAMNASGRAMFLEVVAGYFFLR